MNPRYVAIALFLMFSTVMLFVAGVAWWWVGLIAFGIFTLYALS